MKFRLLFFFAALCLLTTSLSAQEWRLGLQGGVSYNIVEYFSYFPSPAVELNIDRSFGERLHLQSGLRYTESKHEFKLATSFGSGGRLTPGYGRYRHLQLPVSIRYRILGNKFRWKAGVGFAPDLIVSRTLSIPTLTGEYIKDHSPQKEYGLAFTLSLLDLEYSVSDKLSVGLDFDYQYYLLYSHGLFENSHRQTLFLTTSYRLK